MRLARHDGAPAGEALGLTVTNLVTGYHHQPAVHAVSLEVPTGSFAAVIGPNGAGKSSLLRALAGVNQVWRGEVRWRGEDIAGLSAATRVQRGVCAVLQGAPAFPRMSVDENLRVGARISTHAGIGVDEIYDLFPELAQRRRQLAHQLSGGERQMLALARTICTGPSLLLVDEPSFGLAVGVRYRLLSMVDDFRRRFGWTVFMAEQDVSMVSQASSIYYMASGRCERMEASVATTADGSGKPGSREPGSGGAGHG